MSNKAIEVVGVEHFYMAEPLLWTSLAYFIIGGILVFAAFRLSNMHPIERTPILALHFKPEGAEALIKALPLVYMFGAFIFSCALEHIAHWAYARGTVSKEVVFGLAVAEAIISITTAVYVVWLAIQFGAAKCRKG